MLCRVRPLVDKERGGGGGEPVKVTSVECVKVATERGEKDFEFDRVFAPKDGQKEVSGRGGCVWGGMWHST